MVNKKFYNIDNELIPHCIQCANCGNLIDVTELTNCKINGLEYARFQNMTHLNPLIICDKLSLCCNTPNYHFVTDEYYGT